MSVGATKQYVRARTNFRPAGRTHIVDFNLLGMTFVVVVVVVVLVLVWGL